MGRDYNDCMNLLIFCYLPLSAHLLFCLCLLLIDVSSLKTGAGFGLLILMSVASYLPLAWKSVAFGFG